MSLLLDALKKAADEKNKAAEAAEKSALDDGATTSANKLKEDEAKKDGSVKGKKIEDEKSDESDDLELSLDDEALQDIAQQGESLSAYQEKYRQKEDRTGSEQDYDRLSEVVLSNAGDDIVSEQDDEEIANNGHADQVVRAPDRAGGNLDYDVSDEALDLLIHKTNRSYRKNKVIWVVLVSILSLTVLIAGGVHFTEEMQSEVAFLETRHKQSMRLVREKTSRESLPDKSVIIENLVGDEALAKKVEFTKAELEKEKNKLELDARQKKSEQEQGIEKGNNSVASVKPYARKSVLSIEKSQQVDPVSLWLDEAWLAYDAGDYEQADYAYEKVLRKEKNNRDALLGRGAIALQNKSISQAKIFYLALLDINPRDPDAISALTSLAQSSDAASDQGTIENKQSTKSEQYLKNLLQENEQSAVLNFSLGSVYAGQSRWELAQERFFKAWVNDNANAGYAYNLAVSLDQLGKSNEAKRFYQESLRLSKNKKVQFSKQSVLDRIVQIN